MLQVLIALRKCAVKNEEDAEMAHAVAAHLVRALADYKDYTGIARRVLDLDPYSLNCWIWIRILKTDPDADPSVLQGLKFEKVIEKHLFSSYFPFLMIKVKKN